MRRGSIIAGAIALVLAVLAVVFLVLPKMSDVRDAQDAVEQARADEVSLETELARLKAVEQDAPRIRRQLARFRKAVPPVADLPGLINLLQDQADRSEVEFFSISPGDPLPLPTGTAAEIPADIQVIGSFFQVHRFLDLLEKLPRASKVVTIGVSAGQEEDQQTLTIDVSLSTEFYTTDTAAGPGAPVEGAPGATPGATPSPTPSPSPTEEG